MRAAVRHLALSVVIIVVATACSSSTSNSDASNSSAFGDPGSCVVVDVATSPEKNDLMLALAKSFNASSDAKLGGDCIFVRPQKKASGAAATLLSSSWDESTDGPRPVIWTPAASSWGTIVNSRLTKAGQQPIVSAGEPFMVTPLTIAMPKPMADALGYPAKAIGWSDILSLATNKQGWAAFGHPEWGAFRLGKTNPNFSTSGLNSLIAQAYAATGKTSGLSLEDLAAPNVASFAIGVESSVVHYGDTTLTFLNNLYKADQRGTALSYVSAIAVEEKSVIDYNLGNPDGILDAGEKPRAPRTPLVAIYPKEGTLFSDSPLYVLDASWVSQKQKDAAKAFIEYVKRPENQTQVLKYNFRPGNTAVPIADPIVAANGVNPDQPQTLFEVPQAAVLTKLLEAWSDQRKKARVSLVLDVSGSMGDPADPSNEEAGTKLDLAKQAAIGSIDQFSPDDEVSLTIFSTGLGDGSKEFVELVPTGRVADIGEQLRTKIRDLTPQNGTPLYDLTKASYDSALASFDATRINAVVLLTDGRNDDGKPEDDDKQLQDLVTSLRSGSEGQANQPVRVFAIAYGTDADESALKTIADAASSLEYSAKDPKTITNVLNAVISNF
ncbi:MAG: substrate-binding domain-containing protein [Acidimicrobiales bacterium]